MHEESTPFLHRLKFFVIVCVPMHMDNAQDSRVRGLWQERHFHCKTMPSGLQGEGDKLRVHTCCKAPSVTTGI